MKVVIDGKLVDDGSGGGGSGGGTAGTYKLVNPMPDENKVLTLVDHAVNVVPSSTINYKEMPFLWSDANGNAVIIDGQRYSPGQPEKVTSDDYVHWNSRYLASPWIDSYLNPVDDQSDPLRIDAIIPSGTLSIETDYSGWVVDDVNNVATYTGTLSWVNTSSYQTLWSHLYTQENPLVINYTKQDIGTGCVETGEDTCYSRLGLVQLPSEALSPDISRYYAKPDDYATITPVTIGNLKLGASIDIWNYDGTSETHVNLFITDSQNIEYGNYETVGYGGIFTRDEVITCDVDTIRLPEKKQGLVRDLLLNLEITSEVPLTFSSTDALGYAVNYIGTDSSTFELEQGTNIMSFTDISHDNSGASVLTSRKLLED